MVSYTTIDVINRWNTVISSLSLKSNQKTDVDLTVISRVFENSVEPDQSQGPIKIKPRFLLTQNFHNVSRNYSSTNFNFCKEQIATVMIIKIMIYRRKQFQLTDTSRFSTLWFVSFLQATFQFPESNQIQYSRRHQ